MEVRPKNYWQFVALALVGLAFVCTGLSLAVLGNLKRFSLNVADDRNIQLISGSGFVCTLVGIGVFLFAVARITKSMPEHCRTNANIGVGLGFALQLAGLFLLELSRISAFTGLALILAGLPAFVWGAVHYAQGKGHSRWLGLLGTIGILGFIILILLPHRSTKPLPTTVT